MARRRAVVRGLAVGVILLGGTATPAAAQSDPTVPETSTTVEATVPDPADTSTPVDTPAPETTTTTTEPVAPPAGESTEAPPADETTDETAVDEASESETTTDGDAEASTSEDVVADESTETTGGKTSRATPATTRTSRVKTASGSGSATTGTGQQLNIQITVEDKGDGTADVTGNVSIGLIGAAVNVVFIVDTSGSTDSPAGDCNGDGTENAGDDFNADSSPGEIIDCQIAGVLEINDQLKGINGVETGLVEFNSLATVVNEFAAPNDPAFETGVRSLTSGGGTDFDVALESANSLFATAPAGNQKIAYFFSDGFGSLSQGPSTPLAAAIAAGIQVNTFSVGEGASGCGPESELRIIADATGGTCTEVLDPTQLTAVVGDLRPAGIEKVTLRLNDGTEIEVPIDLLGNFSVTIDGLVLGADDEVVATVTATDGTTAVAEAVLLEDDGVIVEPVPLGPPIAGTPTLISAAPVAEGADTLPTTGSDSGRLAGIAAALLLAGLGAVVTSRRLRTD